MSIHSWIAGRYFRSRQRQRFLPLLTIVSIGSVALGIMALVVVLSVMKGFGHELESKFMGFNSHITLSQDTFGITTDDIRELLARESIRDVAPYVEGEAIAQSKYRDEISATGVKIRGIDPEALGSLKTVEFYFPEGSEKFSGLNTNPPLNPLPGVVLGHEILSVLMVHPDFEDKIDLIAPLADVGPTGEMEPRKRSYRLIGAFRSGVYEYDSKYVFISISEARKLLGAQGEEGFLIRLANPTDAPRVANFLRKNLKEGCRVESWDVQNKKLFAALKLERIAMGGILFLTILIASFSIVGVLMMIVSSKRKDIAILRATGMCASSIRKIFLVHGMWIGAIGSTIGGIIGSLLCAALWRWPIRLPASYYLDTLPVEWSTSSTIVFITAGVLIAMLASVYPVTQATAEDPVIALRYE